MQKSRLFLSTTIVLSALGFQSVFAQKSLDKWHQDKDFGFEVRLLSKWQQLPLQPDERTAIAKFDGPEIEIVVGKGFPAKSKAELEILRFPTEKKDITTGSGPKAPSKDPRSRLEEFEERQRPKTFEEWIKKGRRTGIKELQTKEVAYGKLAAKEHDFTFKGNIIDYHSFAVEFALEGQAIVLLYTVPDSQYEKWEAGFRTSARTFNLIAKNKNAETVVASGKRASELTLEEQRKRHQSDVSKVPGWELEETAHYFIKIHSADREFIEQVKFHIELIRARLEADFPPVQPITVKSVLRVCKSPEEYHGYGAPGGSAGYWNSGTEELVVYDDKERERYDTFRTMYHEGFHQYIHYRCGELAPHSWYNEGTGDYYYGANLKYGKLEVRPAQVRLDTIRDAIHGNRHIPLEKILRWSQAEYYRDAHLAYAEGWSIVYFLREGKKAGAKGWRNEWDNILSTYLNVLTESRDPDKAVDRAFFGVNLTELEKAWMTFIKGV